MNRLHVALLGLLLLSACHRKHDDEPTPGPGSTIPGAGSTFIRTYKGSIDHLLNCGQDCIQRVPVEYDRAHYATDSISVYLCRNATCGDNLPPLDCSGASGAMPCFVSIPNRSIFIGKDVVGFVNASIAENGNPGFSSYLITTVIRR